MFIYDIGSNPAIALGGLEEGVSPLDISKIFSTLSNNGYYSDPVCITKITDSLGNMLYEYDPELNDNNHRVMEEPEAYFVTNILEKVILEGTGKGANIGRPAAGKTGTTSDYRDAWFAGYTPELTTVVWMGFLESNQPMEPINGRTIVGGSYPADIWREFMSAALEGKQVEEFKVPGNSLLDIEVCKDSGKLPTPWCPRESIGFMIFVQGKEPVEFCDIHNKVTVPDVIGQNIDNVRQMFSDLYFVINEIYETDETYNENIIFNTDPGPGTIIEAKNGNPLDIDIYISKGLQKYDMPDLTGITKEKALKLIKGIGLKEPEIKYEYNSDQPVDRIFSQNPAALSKVDKTTVVTIYISKGEDPESSIPDVIGKIEKDAIDLLEAKGFKNITIVYEESDKEIDKVFAQIPESGTVYLKGSEVIVKISLGIKVPAVINMKKSDAVTLLEGLGFSVSVLPDASYSGKVISQTPSKDTYLDYGSNIIITIQDSGSTATETTATTETTGSTGTSG